MIELILMVLIFSYVVINVRLNKYQISNISVFLILLPVILIGIFLERYQFIVNLLIIINIIALLLIPLLQLVNRKISILKEIKSRYFYVFTIIIYLYIFLLLIGKNQTTVYQNQIMFPSLIVIVFSSFAYFLSKTFVIVKNKIDFKQGIISIIINSGLLFFISLISLIYYPVPIMINSLLIGILFLFPILLKCYKNSKEDNCDIINNHIMIIVIITFLSIGLIDLVIPNSAYLFINNNSLKLLNIGLYTSCLLTLPTLVKFKSSFMYDILIFLIMTIIVYYLY